MDRGVQKKGKRMRVRLLYASPLWLCANAIRMSRDNHHLSDSFSLRGEEHGENAFECVSCGACGSDSLYADEAGLLKCRDCGYAVSPRGHTGKKDRDLIYRVGNKLKHEGVLEQLVYWFDVDGISRACLQELARHRTARLTVKSTRYTLKELKKETEFFDFETNTADFARAQKYVVLPGDITVDFAILKSLELLRRSVAANKSNDVAKYAVPESFKTRLQWQIDMRNLQRFLSLRLSSDALWEIRELALRVASALPEEHKYLVSEIVREKWPERYEEFEKGA